MRPFPEMFADSKGADRIRFFGGFLEDKEMGTLPADQFRVVLLKSSRRATFLKYGLCVVAGHALPRRYGVTLDDVEVVRTRELRCFPLPAPGDGGANSAVASRLSAEIDGEFFAALPVTLSLTPRRLLILRPRER